MRRLATPIAVLTLLAVVASACADEALTPTTTTTTRPPDPTTTTRPPSAPEPIVPGPGPAMQVLRADVPRSSADDVTPAELAALVAGDTAFAFDLLRIAGGEGNLLFSPHSIATALTMTYAGARGTTAAEMREVMRIGVGDDRLHSIRNRLDLLIAEAPPPLDADDDREPFTIRLINSVWGQRDYPFLEDFLAVLAAEYDAGMNLVDFIAAAEHARMLINDWVEEQTAGRITELIPEGAVHHLTRLVLVNAVWFQANWAVPFDPDATADGTFTLLDGSPITVPLMRQNERMPYVAGDGYQAVRLPYAGDASMLVVVPDAGRFTEVAAAFGPADLEWVRRNQSEHIVDLAFPSFEFRSEFSLKQALLDLGMVDAFTAPGPDDGADFIGITAERELFIHDVLHQAFIAVDEQGTEAAAATAVIIGLLSASPAGVTVDRPFLFFIEHDSTGAILFMGRVTDPR